MKWAIAAGAVLASAIVLIGLFGMTLPADHVISRRAAFHQTPQTVFAVLSGPQDWRAEVARSEAEPPSGGRQRWTEYDKRGRGVLYELVDSAPPLRRSVRIADESLPYGGTWTFDIMPAPGGCVLRITERGTVRNPLFRFVSHYFMGHSATIDGFLLNLGRKFKEPVVIEDEGKPWDKAPPAVAS